MSWVAEYIGGHKAGGAGETPSCNVEAASALALQATPIGELAEGSLHDLAPLQKDEAFLVGPLLDNAAEQAVEVAPLLAAMGREGTVEEGQTLAGPVLLRIARWTRDCLVRSSAQTPADRQQWWASTLLATSPAPHSVSWAVADGVTAGVSVHQSLVFASLAA